MILVSPPFISDAIKESWLGDSFGYENASKLSRELPDWYSQLSKMYGCVFFDASEHVVASNTDGCHMDAENQRKLGSLLAEQVAGILGGKKAE